MKKNDFIGDLLLDWRIRAVYPYINGKLLDLGCGLNYLIIITKKYG